MFFMAFYVFNWASAPERGGQILISKATPLSLSRAPFYQGSEVEFFHLQMRFRQLHFCAAGCQIFRHLAAVTGDNLLCGCCHFALLKTLFNLDQWALKQRNLFASRPDQPDLNMLSICSTDLPENKIIPDQTAADGRGCRRMSNALKLGPIS
jgi:hypothetical protein